MKQVMCDRAPVYLPDWAIGHATQATQVGAQLCTRDGRRTGNAVIIRWPVARHGLQLAEVVTDAGTTLFLTENELKELYHPPVYLLRVSSAPGVRLRALDDPDAANPAEAAC